MIQGFYTAGGSMIAQQQKINVIAGNIANVNTNGYKKNNVGFSEVVYTEYQNMDAGAGGYIIGNGVRITDAVRDLSQGAVMQTGRGLDLSMEGDGYMTLRDGAGNLFYTRGGSFQLSVEGEDSYIVDSNGNYLMDSNMQRINAGGGEFTVTSDGVVVSGGAVQGSLRIVGFEHAENLRSVGGGLYIQTAESGGETAAASASVRQSSIERSNVNLASEFTDLIAVQRLYQISSKVVQTIDEMQGMANSLRK